MGVYEGGGTGSGNVHTAKAISGGAKQPNTNKVAPVKVGSPAKTRTTSTKRTGKAARPSIDGTPIKIAKQTPAPVKRTASKGTTGK
jgi:hypothetical protein